MVRGRTHSDFLQLYHWEIGETGARGHIVYIDTCRAGFIVTLRLQSSTHPTGEGRRAMDSARGMWLWEYGSRRPIANGPGIARRDTGWKRAGFAAYARHDGTPPTGTGQARRHVLDDYAVEFPYWTPIALLGLPSAWYLARRWRQRRTARMRRRAGLCPACGYDLRGSPHGCPECGEGRDAPVRGVAGA